MHTFTLLSLLPAFALSASIPHTKRFVEQTPWHLTDLTVFTAANSSTSAPPANSSISFTFCDSNAGIELETTCSHSAPVIVSDGSNGYFDCTNQTVSFYYTGSEIYVNRVYIDPSVGPCPQWCNVGAYGHNSTSLTVRSTSEAGTTSTQTELDVPVTSLIAKK